MLQIPSAAVKRSRHGAQRFAVSAALLLASACAPAPPPAPRVLDIPTSDGIVLKGTLFAAPAGGPAVLLLHQCDAQRKVWDPLGVRLAAAGITALSVDYRTYGESGGTPHEKLSNEEMTQIVTTRWPSDIDAAFDVLTRQSGVQTTRVGVAGGSCGAHHAVQFAGRHANVKAVAMLAGGTDREGRIFLEGADAPPLFAAAAADDQYENFVEIMSWYFGVSRRPESRLAHYADGGHAALVFTRHPDLADDIARWFDALLNGHPDRLPATRSVPLAPAVMNELRTIDQPGGAAAAMARRATPASPPIPPLPEYLVNLLGYEHLLAKDYPDAIDLMKLGAQMYPASPNTMDSLGDAYLAAGDKAAALEAAKQTLVLLDRDTADKPERKANIRAAAEGKITQLSGGK